MSDIAKLQQEIKSLERSVERERRGRKDAEDVLRTKTFELIEAQKQAETAAIRLRQALIASKQIVWEYFCEADKFVLYANEKAGISEVAHSSSSMSVFKTFEGAYFDEFMQQWQKNLDGKSKSLDVVVKRISRGNGKTIFSKITGRVNETDDHGKAVRLVGTYEDVTQQMNMRRMHDVITNSFLRYEYPSFVIDVKQKYVETNAVLIKELGIDTKFTDLAELNTFVPLDLCILQQESGNKAFISSITTNSGESRKVQFRLSPMEKIDGKYPYCVGTFRNIDK